MASAGRERPDRWLPAVTTSRFECLVEKDKDFCAGLHHVPLIAIDSKLTKHYSEVRDTKGRIAVFSGVSFMSAGGAVDRRNLIAVYAK